MKKNILNKKGVYFSLLVSFLITISIPIIANIATFFTSNNLIKTQNSNNQKIIMDNTKNKYIEIYDKASLTLSTIANNRIIIDYANVENRDYYKEYTIKLYIAEMIISQPSISNVYIYFPEYNYVIYDSGGSSSFNFTKYYLSNLTYIKWKEIMDNGSTTMKTKHISENDISHSFIYRNISTNENSPVICMIINNKAAFKNVIMDDLKSINNFIVYSDNTLLLHKFNIETILNNQNDLNNMESLEELLESHKKNTTTLHNNKYNLYFTFFNNEKSKNEKRFFYITLGSFISCVILGITLSIKFSKSYSIQVSNVLKLLKTTSNNSNYKKDQEKHFKNEFRQIDNIVSDYITNYTSISIQLKRYSNELTNAYITRLLDVDSKENHENIVNTLNLYGKTFCFKYYLILIYSYSEKEPPLDYTKIINDINNIFAWISFINVKYKDNMIWILNWEEAYKYAEIEDNISKINSQFIESAEFTLHTSDVFFSLDKLKTIYTNTIISTKKAADNLWVEKTKEIISIEYSNPNFSTSFISEELGLNRSHLSRLFKEFENIGLHEYIREYRIKKSEILLLDDNIKISEVAQKTGFNSVENFIRNFKKIKKITPGQYQKLN